MLIDQMIQELRIQKREVERAIELLESFERDSLERRGYKSPPNSGIAERQRARRGRKFMTLAERRVVSERMKLYWSARKREENQNKAGQPSAATISKQSESRPGTRT